MPIINCLPMGGQQEEEAFQFGYSMPGATYSNGKITSIQFNAQDYYASFYSIYRSILTSVKLKNCTTIGYKAFAYCSHLTTISFPNCTFISSYAFSYCSSLISANFPKCTSIGYQAFYSCYTLTNAIFPVCTIISSYGFAYCSKLTTISFPECTYIGYSAFEQCSSLTTASFPKCSYIGSYAFKSCISLSALYLMSSGLVTGNSYMFISTPFSLSSYLGYFGSIYVPSSLLASYKAAAHWKSYNNRLVGI